MNLAAKLTAHAADTPERVALVWRDDEIAYAALADRAARAAGGLRGQGVGPGDRVAIACANTPYFVVAYLAALWVGAVAVPLNPHDAPEELARELRETGARLVIVGPAGRRAVGDALAAGGGDAAGDVAVLAAGSSAEHEALPGQVGSWDDLLAAEPIECEERSPEDLAVLVFTSGTSGAPRAAMLMHGNLGANLNQAMGHPTMTVEAGEVVLGVLPLFHVYGLNAVLGLALAAGAQVVLAERFDPYETLELVKARGVTLLAGVPPMFQAWLALPEIPSGAFESVRIAISGASPLPPSVQEQVQERFGLEVQQGYGLTEASPVVTTTGVGDGAQRGSIGVPLPGVDVRVVDTDGEDVLVGDPGEIWVRGPNVFAGYWQDEEATARVLTGDGWLKTGDIAVAGEHGFLSIVDRSKDLIIVSGFNVYPAEVEQVLARHEGVAEVAVAGIPHPYSGEAVKAFVVPAPGAQLDEDELIEFCGEHLARYKHPTAVEFVEEPPRGLAGKLLRRALDLS